MQTASLLLLSRTHVQHTTICSDRPMCAYARTYNSSANGKPAEKLPPILLPPVGLAALMQVVFKQMRIAFR